MTADRPPRAASPSSRWPAWWPNIYLRRKVYAVVLLLLTFQAALWMKHEDFGWGYISLSVPLVIAAILWVCPFRFSELQVQPSAASLASANPPVVLKNRIILFSDGTGNSSAKLFKTNVWRMYQLIDFGPDPDGKLLQIGSYNNGVGTSSFKPLAILGGIFGFGLQANVLHLYRFLCRNYKEGDEILAFGFSRGAFTIRMLVALIADQGVLTEYVDERDLAYRSRAIYRDFMRSSLPTVFPFITVAVRWLRDMVLWAAAWLMDPRRKPNVIARPDISFVGLWDTVAAYGGPITEITRGIDKWVAPLSMTDYKLSPKVKVARHALALDDERDSFQPLVWDELHEAELAQALETAQAELARLPEGSPEAADFRKKRVDPLANCKPGRVKQVWFAGMHADVGGGYPDESLSYVSLLWMIDEIGPRLRLIDDDVRRLRISANMLGPIHDSREGLGSYYRYQPRKIDALLHHDGDIAMMSRTLSLRDP
ncbi:MAG: DUF2235 domain-containing protein, partial [Novosphingobium sp.]|nr:DUF2235 domain-containing protein [Novosphingobium sp.]